MPNELHSSQDYNITKLEIIPQHGTGTPVAIHQVMIEMHIYEDIYKPFLTGTIVIDDGVGLASKLPISGEEHLELTLETPGGETVDHKFYVYKVSERVNTGDNKQTYMLSFCSHEMMKNAKTSASYGFNGELISDMVQKIYDQFLAIDKEIDIEPTLTPRRMSFPNWSPSKILLNMARTAQSATYPEGSDYRFWEDFQGFHFRSIQSLIEEIEPIKDSESRERLHWTPHNVLDNSSAMVQAIEEFNIISTVNNLARVVDGTFASKMFSFDPIQGSVTITEKTLADVWESFKSLEPNQPVGVEAVANLFDPNSNIRMLLTDASEQFASGIENFAQTARAQAGLFGNTQIDIQLPGNTNRKIGDVVELRLPQPGPRETEGFNLDRQLSSNAMITAINHGFTRGKYKQIIKVVKDSSFEEVKTEE